jgi:predicted RNA-binding protein with PUA-like domain
MSTKMLFYIVKSFGLIKRGMRVKRMKLISAGPVLTLYLAHSHCDTKYVNLIKGLISEFLFSTKESTNSGSKYFKPPSQKQMVAPSCFDISCYEKLEKVYNALCGYYKFSFRIVI